MSQPPSDQPAERHPGYGPNPPYPPQGQPAAAPYPPQGQPAPAPYATQGQPAPAPYPPQYTAPGGYAPPQQPHPGYPANPPAAATPRHPGYGPNPPGAPGRPGASAAQPGSGVASRNPLGLAALVLGAVGPVLGFLFVFIQAAMFASGGAGAFAAISTAQSVLVGLTALAAVILGLVAISKPGSPKALASAGLALGAAGLLGVLGAIIYPVVISAFYR